MYLNPYGVPAVITTTLFFILTVLALKNNPKRRANQAAAIAFLAFLVWGVSEIVEKFASQSMYDTALIAERSYGIGVFLAPVALLHLSLVFPRVRKVPGFLIPLLYVSTIPMLGLMFFTDLFIKGVVFDPVSGGGTGWEADYGPWVAGYFGYAVLMVGTAIAVFISTWWKAKLKIERIQVAIIMMGLLFDTVLLVGTFVIPTLFMDGIPFFFIPTTVPLVIFAAAVLYSIHKYKLFVIEAVTEAESEAVPEPALEVKKGFTHIVEEPGVEESYKAFRNMVTAVPGLSITTTHPDKVRTQRALGKTPIIWLTETASGEMAINPWRLDFEISYSVKNFMEENPETVVIIDDLEYLSSVNGFGKLLEFVRGLNDTASMNNATIIAPVNPASFPQEDYHMLVSAFDSRLEAPGHPCGIPSSISGGYTYLVCSEKLPESLGLIKERIKENPALCITKTFPEKFVKQHGLSGIKTYWLTDSQSGDEKYISPARLEFELTEVVSNFCKDSPDRTVVIDGLERLVQVNGFKRTLDYVKYVGDIVSSSGGVLFVSMEGGSLKDNEMATLQKKFDSSMF